MNQEIIQDSQHSRGYTVINVNFDAVEDLTDLFLKENPSASILSLSGFISNPDSPLSFTNPVIILQNLTAADFQSNIQAIHHRLIAPLLSNGTKIIFISEQDPFRIKTRTGFRNLHYEPNAVRNLLITHKCERLLKNRNVFIDYENPSAKTLPPEKEKVISPLVFPLDSNLDIRQQEAVNHIEGPVRLLAPAGSGKTKTLINRIVHIINAGVDQDKILAVAFNKKAALEMMSRLESLNITNVNVRTLHSMGYEIVRKKFDFSFEEEEEDKKYSPLIMEILDSLSVKESYAKRLIQNLVFLIQIHKSNFIPIKEIKERFRFLNFDYESFFFQLVEKQIDRGVLTFDDMIYFAVYALITDRRLRENYQDKFDFVLVDEFQDVNNAQLFMCEILAMPQDNLFVVGDDDQMIYGWRGASNRHILCFPQNFPGCREIILENNYRSAPSVVNKSKQLIGHNRIRVTKMIKADRKPGNESVRLSKSGKLSKQAREIARWILKLKKGDETQWEDFAILFRYNILQFPLSLALKKHSIPHSAPDYEILRRIPIGRDMIDIVTLICKPDEENPLLLQRALRKYVKKIPLSITDNINSRRDLNLFSKSDTGIKKFDSDLRKAVKISKGFLTRKQKVKKIFTIFNVLRDYDYKSGLRPANQDYEKDESVFEAIKNILEESESLEKGMELLTAISGIKTAAEQGGVRLSSIHRAKGLEFKNVAVFNCSDDIDTDTPGKLEEERRIFYVATTRAKNNLLASAPKFNPSPFLKEFFV